MRALLVCASPSPGAEELVVELAADSEMVVAVDGGGAVCLAAGVTPDLLIGDFDSLAPGDLVRLEASGVEVVRFPAEKDASDLELALRIASQRGATQITVTSAFSGRLDHTLVALGVVAASRVPSLLAEPEVRGWCLIANGRNTLSLRGEGETVSLLAFGGPAVVSATGVDWPLMAARLDPRSSRGLSNRIAGPTAADIAVELGTVWVLAPGTSGSSGAREA